MRGAHGASRTLRRRRSLADPVFLQECDDHRSVVLESTPYRSTPIFDRGVTFRSSRSPQHIENRDGPPILGQIHPRPFPFSASEHPVRFLDLTARKLPFNAQVKPRQTKDNRNRLAGVVRGLNGGRIRHMLDDKPGASQRVSVHLVICGAHCIDRFRHMSERNFLPGMDPAFAEPLDPSQPQ